MDGVPSSSPAVALERPTGQRRLVRRIFSAPALIVPTFIAVHIWLGVWGLTHYGWPFGDVTSVYHWWSYQAVREGTWFGLTDQWVYPLLAMIPMLLTLLFSTSFGLDYTVTWLGLVTVLDVAALLVFTEGLRNRHRLRLVWWWMAALLALGPVAIGRIDVVALALAIMGLSLLEHRPRAAGLLLAVGTWVKIWPAALLLAGLAAFRRARRRLVMPGVWLTAGLAALAMLVSAVRGQGLSGLATLFGFVRGQTSRNLQVEAVGATWGLWQARAGDGSVVYNTEIYTNELISDSSVAITQGVTVAMGLIAAAVALLALVQVRRSREPRLVAAWASLALVTALIVCNKVGSPQFEVWLIAPVLLLGAMRAPHWWRPAVLVTLIGVLTQVIYPYWYGYLLNLSEWMLWVITVRNLALVALMVWGVVGLMRLPRVRR